jgi:voltage-gated potassium channel
MLDKIINKINDIIFNVKRSVTIKLVIIFILTLFISTVGVYLVEKTKNEQFKSLFDSLWYTIVTLSTVGYGDKTPLTTGGKLLGILIIFFGVATMGAVSGKIASYLVGQQLKEEKGMAKLSKLTNHYVICGWQKELKQILKDILKVNPKLDPSNIVIINFTDPSMIDDIRSDRELSKIRFIYGDYSDETILRKANIKKAKTCIILADQTNPSATSYEVDTRTVMTAMTIKAITKEIYLCAEILNPKFERYLTLSYCDEVIYSRLYSRILVANASASYGVSHVIHKLIDVDSETPIKIIEFPENFIGKPFKDLIDFYAQKNYILIGLLENIGNAYLRKKEAVKEAQKTRDIVSLISNLKNVEKVRANEPVLNPKKDYIIKPNSRAIVILSKS